MKKKSIIVFLMAIMLTGCTEQYLLQTSNFEQALVVEATITNELKHQQIKITRTFRFEEDGPQVTNGADVYISSSDGTEYEFEQNEGVYLSVSPFQAEAGKNYTLHILTSDGKSYVSTAESLTTVSNLEDVTAEVATIDGIRGVQINAKSFDPANTSKYYRFEYEETYKVIAPRWSMYDANRVQIPGAEHDGIEVVPRGPEEIKTCFSTVVSNEIIQTTTTDLSEDRVDYSVRFISDQNPIISHRYSILVRQYVQNLASYTFYKTLKELSGSESILSQNQPGFFYGNMRSEEDASEKVVGFFDVSSVSSKRIFFNYADLFPGEDLPPYFDDCSLQFFKFCFIPNDWECRGAALLSVIGQNTLLYFDHSDLDYFMVRPACGDCTEISSNVIPAFWED